MPKNPENPFKLIGFLRPAPSGRGHIVICPQCIDTLPKHLRGIRTRVFEENILPYNQDCFDCGALLVNGGTGTNLFEDPPRLLNHDYVGDIMNENSK